MSTETVNDFKIPGWAAKPLDGLHLDVLKEGKLVQKIMIDQKKYYFFGRNKTMCDVLVEHQSCSRCHAVLVWHRDLQCPFLFDLGSVHGTFIGKIRLEPKNPVRVTMGSEIHFGASTRVYVIREKPTALTAGDKRSSEIGPELKPADGSAMASDAYTTGTLPETDYELDNLTEFNTAHNRRISSLMNMAMVDVKTSKAKKRHVNFNVHFNDHEEIINPEDVDPTVGRFRNLVEQAFIPYKRTAEAKGSANMGVSDNHAAAAKDSASVRPVHDYKKDSGDPSFNPSFALAAKLGLPMPNLAPDLDMEPQLPPSVAVLHAHAHNKLATATGESHKEEEDNAPRKKKYMKETWPGKRPVYLVGSH